MSEERRTAPEDGHPGIISRGEMGKDRFLGIFVNPVYVQNEGLQAVFDNLESVGTKAICIPPVVCCPDDSGQRFPDLHVDGFEREVARPVWGLREIRLKRFTAYEPNLALYNQVPYVPRVQRVPAGVDTAIPRLMVAEAKKRGIGVHIFCQPFLPPNIRREDQPVRIDGSTPQPPQVALSACLNSPAARAYALASIQDLIQHFSDMDGLMPDWVEYGAYCLEDHFTCFCGNCELRAREAGFDWESMKCAVSALWNWLHSLTPHKIEHSLRLMRNPSEILEILARYPGWVQFLRFKAQTVVGFYREVRQLLDQAGLDGGLLSARGWPPPWNRSSGMDYHALSDVCDSVTPKLFTFDYSVLPRWYGQTLLRWNPDLSESEVLDALLDWMNLPDDLGQRSFAHYHIPSPEELHPAKLEAYRIRLDEVVDQVAGKALCHPFAHAYLPEPQWKRMIALIRDSRVDGMWVQMYGYLSDRKLQILRDMWH